MMLEDAEQFSSVISAIIDKD